MKVEFTVLQIEGILLSLNEALSQLESSKIRNKNLEVDISKDIELISRINDKILAINNEKFTAFTKYEIYTLISVASNYEELHEQPQDTIVNKVSKVKVDILDIIRSPLPYIDVIYIRMAKE